MKTLRDICLGALLAALLLLLCMLPAFATGSHPSPHPTTQPSPTASTPTQLNAQLSSNVSQSFRTKSSANATGVGESSSVATSTGGKSTSKQDQHQTAKGGNAASTAAVSGVSATAGQATSSSDNAVEIHGDTIEAPRLPVATAIAGGTNTTAGCRYSVGGAGQAAILGLSLGFGRKDRDCERLGLAQYMYDRGNPDAGDVIMCRITELRQAFGAECLDWLRRSRLPAVEPEVVIHGPTAHQTESREAFERGDHLK